MRSAPFLDVLRGVALPGLALLLALPVAAEGPVDTGPHLEGEAEIGGRTVSGDFDSAKYEEYRELRPGIFGRGNFLLENGDRSHYLRGWLEDVRERDERYTLQAGRWGWGRLTLDYAELPHVYSNQARSPFVGVGSTLFLDDQLQAYIQSLGAMGAAVQSEGLRRAISDAPGRSLEFRLRTAGADAVVEPIPGFELYADYGIQDRTGTRPLHLGFGSPGGTFVAFAAPIDEQIHEANAGIRVARDSWNLELGYTGSWFENDLTSVTVDNPLRVTDASGNPSRGRLSLDPDNSAHGVRLSGAVSLPVDFPLRLTGTVSWGIREQDEDFLCHTVNTAFLPTPDTCPIGVKAMLALPRSSLEGEVQTLLTNFVVTARPHPRLNLTGRWRLYDYDNKTPELVFPDHVINDANYGADTRISVANEFRRQNADLDAAWRLGGGVTLHLGGDWEQWSRSNDREVRRLDEYGGEVALDWRAGRHVQLRAGYGFGIRRGTEYETFAHLRQTVLPSEVEDAALTGQLTSLRKYDEADRERNELDLLARFVPHEDVMFTLTGSWKEYDYDETRYGLMELEQVGVGGDLSWTPLSWLSVSTWYTFEDIRREQASRWRPRGFAPPIMVIDDPVNDWFSTSKDQVHAAGLRFDLVLVPDRLDATIGYAIQHANGRTRSWGRDGFAPFPPGSTTAADGGNAVNFPALQDVLQSFETSLRYHVTEHVTLQGAYRFERLDLDDFRHDDLDPFEPLSNLSGSGAASPSRDVFLGNRVEDYDAHIFAVSVIYHF